MRINADADLIRPDAEAACRAGAFGLLVPKVRNPGTLLSLASFLDPIEYAFDRPPLRFVPDDRGSRRGARRAVDRGGDAAQLRD